MSTYDDIAEWYDHWIGTHSMRVDPFFPAVEALIGEVAGQRICNLACGQGRMARHLADLGVRVVGIDLGLFDGVVCFLACSAVHENSGGEQNFVQSIE